MANNKKYVSIINDGTQDLNIKDAEAVKKSGDTMSGDLTMQADIFIDNGGERRFGFKRTVIDAETGVAANIDVGWDWENRDGAGMAFRSTDESLSEEVRGQFHFFARNATQSTVLIGYPDGRLTWGGQSLVTQYASVATCQSIVDELT